jgi:hypothetical protein
MRSIIFTILFMLTFLSTFAQAETAYIVASKDNTLIENSQGAMSNGSGPYFFVGRTNQQANSIRRGLVHFDVASALPVGVRIKSVQLMLYLAKNQGYTGEVSLHRVQKEWGQGMSYSTGGSGDTAVLDDATWIHTFYPDYFWSTMGGDYALDASAVLTVGPDKAETWFRMCNLG